MHSLSLTKENAKQTQPHRITQWMVSAADVIVRAFWNCRICILER